MKTNIKKLPGSQIELEVTLTDQEFEKYYKPLFDEAASKVQIKGFRPGAAPKELLTEGVDHEAVFRAALQEAVRFSLDEIKSQNEWSLIDHPKVEVTNSENGITYKATLTVFPEIELGNYKKIAKKIFGQQREVTVTDEEKEKTLNWLLESRAATVRVDRPAQLKDVVEIDLETTSEGTTVPNSSFKAEKFALGESQFIKGFDEQLVSHKAGDAFEFSITAPADYWQKDLQNKKLDFSVKLLAVYERTLPQANDAFAASLGSQFTTEATAAEGKAPLQKLKESIAEGLAMEKKEKETERQRLEVLSEIVKDSKMELPEILIERTLDGMVAQTEAMIPKTDNKDPEALKKELREKMRDRAKHNVGSHLALYKIAQVEKLEPSKEEIEAEATATGVDLEKHHDYIYDRLQNQKVFKFLESQKDA